MSDYIADLLDEQRECIATLEALCENQRWLIEKRRRAGVTLENAVKEILK